MWKKVYNSYDRQTLPPLVLWIAALGKCFPSQAGEDSWTHSWKNPSEKSLLTKLVLLWNVCVCNLNIQFGKKKKRWPSCSSKSLQRCGGLLTIAVLEANSNATPHRGSWLESSDIRNRLHPKCEDSYVFFLPLPVNPRTRLFGRGFC